MYTHLFRTTHLKSEKKSSNSLHPITDIRISLYTYVWFYYINKLLTKDALNLVLETFNKSISYNN